MVDDSEDLPECEPAPITSQPPPEDPHKATMRMFYQLLFHVMSWAGEGYRIPQVNLEGEAIANLKKFVVDNGWGSIAIRENIKNAVVRIIGARVEQYCKDHPETKLVDERSRMMSEVMDYTARANMISDFILAKPAKPLRRR